MARLVTLNLCFLLVTSLAFGQADSNPVVLSPRVGVDIDPTERAYFGLVLQVRDFRSAHVVTGPAGYYSIILNEGSRAPVMITATQFGALRRYIDRFEYVQETATRDSLVMLTGAVGHRFPKAEGQPVRVTLWDGSRQNGYLVHADTSVIVLSDSADVRESLRNPEGVAVVPVGDVLMVRDERGPLTRWRGELYVVSDGSPEQQARLVAQVTERSASEGRVSPELRQYLAGLQLTSSRRDPGQMASLQRMVRRGSRRLHLSALVGVLPAQNEVGPFLVSRGSGDAFEGGKVGVTTRGLGFGVGFSLTSRLQAGLEAHYAPAPFADEYSTRTDNAQDEQKLRATLNSLASTNGEVGISGWQVSSMVSYSLIRPDELGRLLSQRRALPYEVRVGFGPSLALMKTSTKFVTGTIVSPFNLTYEVVEQSVSAQKLNLGVKGQLAVDIHLTRAASVGIGMDAHFFPQLQADAQSVEFPDVTRSYRLKFERKAIKQSSTLFGFFVSTRIHL